MSNNFGLIMEESSQQHTALKQKLASTSFLTSKVIE